MPNFERQIIGEIPLHEAAAFFVSMKQPAEFIKGASAVQDTINRLRAGDMPEGKAGRFKAAQLQKEAASPMATATGVKRFGQLLSGSRAGALGELAGHQGQSISRAGRMASYASTGGATGNVAHVDPTAYATSARHVQGATRGLERTNRALGAEQRAVNLTRAGTAGVVGGGAVLAGNKQASVIDEAVSEASRAPGFARQVAGKISKVAPMIADDAAILGARVYGHQKEGAAIPRPPTQMASGIKRMGQLLTGSRHQALKERLGEVAGRIGRGAGAESAAGAAYAERAAGTAERFSRAAKQEGKSVRRTRAGTAVVGSAAVGAGAAGIGHALRDKEETAKEASLGPHRKAKGLLQRAGQLLKGDRAVHMAGRGAKILKETPDVFDMGPRHKAIQKIIKLTQREQKASSLTRAGTAAGAAGVAAGGGYAALKDKKEEAAKEAMFKAAMRMKLAFGESGEPNTDGGQPSQASNNVSDSAMPGGSMSPPPAPVQDPEAAKPSGEATVPANYMGAELTAQAAQAATETGFLRERLRAATEQNNALQQQLQQLQEQLTGLQQQSQTAGDQVMQATNEAVSASERALQHSMAAANMRMGIMKMRESMMEVASQDPEQLGTLAQQQQVQEEQMGAQGGDPAAGGGQAPPGQEQPAPGGSPQQPGGAADPAASGEPKPKGTSVSIKTGGAESIGATSGALIGTGLAALKGYQQKGNLPQAQQDVENLGGQQEEGNFARALELAKAKHTLADTELQTKHPVRSNVRNILGGAVGGAAAGAAVGRLVGTWRA